MDKDVKICREFGGKRGEGNDKQESPGIIGIIGKNSEALLKSETFKSQQEKYWRFIATVCVLKEVQNTNYKTLHFIKNK